ncbi:DNA translocase FtsK [Paenibacillus sp. 1A_MP2]|uniref:DNA translocase FtsK n=1 Tax=Paenibacillus sp. 1A_MP2 TaxID=3457495 RepID=UPI003FCD456A
MHEEPEKKKGYLGLSFFNEAESTSEETFEENITKEVTTFDLLYEQAYKFVTEREVVSLDMMMQELDLGEQIAQSLMNAMEQQEIVGPDQNGEREVYALPGVPVSKTNISRWM